MIMICAHTSESSVTHGICTTIFVQTTWILCNNIICTLLKCDHYGFNIVLSCEHYGFNNVLSLCRQDGSQLRLALSLMVTGSWPQRRPRRFQLNYINNVCTGMLACLRVRARSLSLSRSLIRTHTHIHAHTDMLAHNTLTHTTHTKAQTQLHPYTHTHTLPISLTHIHISPIRPHTHIPYLTRTYTRKSAEISRNKHTCMIVNLCACVCMRSC